VSRPRVLRREAVVSLETSCAPAMLLRCGSLNQIKRAFRTCITNCSCSFISSPRQVCGCVRAGFENIFDIFFLPQVPFIHRGETFVRIHRTASLGRRAVACGYCSVPLDSPKVPKSTFRHFKHLLRSLFEVKKKKDSMKGSNKCVLYGFYTNNVLVRP
jgi:hypothetical protein